MSNITHTQTLALVRDAGTAGMTWSDISRSLGIHHGKASEALSILHHNGQVARLKQRRGANTIYVTPNNIDGRDVIQRRYNNLPDQDLLVSLIETWRDTGDTSQPLQLARWITDAIVK